MNIHIHSHFYPHHVVLLVADPAVVVVHFILFHFSFVCLFKHLCNKCIKIFIPIFSLISFLSLMSSGTRAEPSRESVVLFKCACICAWSYTRRASAAKSKMNGGKRIIKFSCNAVQYTRNKEASNHSVRVTVSFEWISLLHHYHFPFELAHINVHQFWFTLYFACVRVYHQKPEMVVISFTCNASINDQQLQTTNNNTRKNENNNHSKEREKTPKKVICIPF